MAVTRVIACLSLSLLAQSRFVDRHRILQDVNTMEEEVGAYGHDETVIIAEEKDSK